MAHADGHPRFRLRVGKGWPPSTRTGVVIDIHNHESNGRRMLTMLFDSEKDQALFGGCRFYDDDLEDVR